MENNIVPGSIRVGDTVRRVIDAIGKQLDGTVIYIHPKHRYYRVEYALGGGIIREAYFS